MSKKNGIEGMPTHCAPGDQISLTTEEHLEAFKQSNGATVTFKHGSTEKLSFSQFIEPPVFPGSELRFLAPSGVPGECEVSVRYGFSNTKLELGITTVGGGKK